MNLNFERGQRSSSMDLGTKMRERMEQLGKPIPNDFDLILQEVVIEIDGFLRKVGAFGKSDELYIIEEGAIL